MAQADTRSPGGKQPKDEDFPVASLFLARRHRAAILAFYRFARAADDIADHPGLDGETKLMHLAECALGLRGQGGHAPSLALHAVLAGDSRLLAHAATLLDAFRRDAVENRCHGWADLMAYCACSAAPVGRFLLDLHGESSDLHPAADSLCAALQILNHLQDVGPDYRALGRVYLPADWMEDAQLPVQTLGGTQGGAALRHVLDCVLDRVEMLIDAAAPLPRTLSSRRLAMQAAATIAVARRQAALLRRHDPLAQRLGLSVPAYVAALLEGLSLWGWRRS